MNSSSRASNHVSVNYYLDTDVLGNESVPNIIINETVNVFLKLQSPFLVISNHSSFRVLFDKIASVYFI